MSRTMSPSHTPRTDAAPSTARRVAIGSAALIGVVYVLIFAGLLSVGRAETGDLGVLGFAGAVFLTLAWLLWRYPGRWLWLGAAVLQIMTGVMYVAVAPDRDPAFEVWGLTIRALSAVLLLSLVTLLWQSRRGTAVARPRRGAGAGG